MKKPSTEKVIIVHRPQKPSNTEKVSQAQENAAVDCGTEMVAPDQPSMPPAQEEQNQKS